MVIVRQFTTPAYYPRTDSRSVQFRDAKLDIAYAVHSLKLDTEAPSPKKFNILFLHGAQFIKEGWNYWIKKAFDQWGDQLGKCIALDHVHHGDSALLNQSKIGFFIPWEDHGRDAGCVIRECVRRGEIHPHAPLIVIAHSMSGSGAMGLAAFDPGLVSALILIDPVWIGPFKLEHADSMSGKFARMSRAAYKKNKDTFENEEEFRDYICNKSIYAKLAPPVEKDLLENLAVKLPDGKVKMKTSRTHQAAAYYAGISAVGIGDSIVKRVRAPTLVLHGDKPDFNPEGSNETLEKTLPHGERKVIQGAAHLVLYTHPDESFDAVKDFIFREYKNHVGHTHSVDSQWGPTAEERFVAQVELQAKGNQPAGFSKL